MIWTGREERSWGFVPGESVEADLVVVRRLGGGHDHESYMCHLDGDEVVAKLIRPNLVDESHPLAGLRRESEVLGALDHPGLVHLLRANLDGPRPMLVLEHCEGSSLPEVVDDSGSLSGPGAQDALLPIAQGLEHMHRAGFVHLDVKPHNVVVGRGPRLIDFGTARSLEDAARMKSPAGTDAYMAPEQTHPADGSLGPKADVWGLGATLYFALTGTPPFPRASGGATGPAGRWPQSTEPLEIPGSLSAPLRALLKRCLDKDPDRRAEMHEVAAAMRAACEP